MTHRENSRVAGFAFLFYIAVGVTQSMVGAGASAGSSTAARVASMAGHAPQVRTNALLGLVTVFTAITLAAALYGLTRAEDQDLAIFALGCRIGEGILGAVTTLVSLTLLSLAMEQTADVDSMALAPVAAVLFKLRPTVTLVGALFFAVGSTVFAYLLLRGRLIPRALAWLGIASSLLLVAALPLQLIGVLRGTITQLIWIPAAAFEVPLGLWLLIKGVNYHSVA